jgi:hypothetical protein
MSTAIPLERVVFRRSGTLLERCIERITTIHKFDVLIKVHAVSLNWKDTAILAGKFPWPAPENGIPGENSQERLSLLERT